MTANVSALDSEAIEAGKVRSKQINVWFQSRTAKVVGGSLISLLVAVSAYMLLQTQNASASTKTYPLFDAKKEDAANKGSPVVSIINGQPVYESEIAPLLNQYPKAVAIDGYINKVLTAQEMHKNPKWSEEAGKRIQAANREVLSAMYFEKIGGEVSASITDAEIADFYAKNISEAMFSKYAASYALYADPESAAEASKGIAEGDKEAPKGFKRFQDQGNKDALFTSQQFPYDLGRVVEGLTAGQYSQPLPTRNGYFIVRLDEKVAGKKPEIKEIRSQIVQTLVSQRLSQSVSALRSAAKIELK